LEVEQLDDQNDPQSIVESSTASIIMAMSDRMISG